MANHEYYMARSLQLAERGRYTADPNPCVGCVIVKDGTIVGEGWHQKAGEGHAEVNALAVAGDKAYQADCYVTLEPCSHFGKTPPCADALIVAGVKRVIIAMTDPNPLVSGQGIDRLQLAGIDVIVGVLTEQAQHLNRGFCQRMRLQRPFVRSKIAMSVDGRTAMASGESQWITGPDARQDVQKLRAESSAILTGIGTIIADNPSLTVRPEGSWYPVEQTIRQPLRVIVDSQLNIAADAKVLTDSLPTLIATITENRRLLDADIVPLPSQSQQVDLNVLMSELAQRQINSVMVEAGSKLNGALLQLGLIDELLIYMAPKLMGDSAKGLCHLPGLNEMSQSIDLAISDVRAVGKDWRITLTPQYKKVH
ncbi:MAG: bifunctional diaminohydroxyphosphoribosylaminopyrimidine deaminase/5-amino-6-(5-phosphoribosylamino)uracil reductase RibD [Gammaproteobacteria bacterium]|nr:bifunctional diaminohydroxyphosphoribosylaminopyrimidine deaminase/5-amino-6-(5-phosphoribosylamino)uracil reductase RibD [Gammaproteobacteria bacterium]